MKPTEMTNLDYQDRRQQYFQYKNKLLYLKEFKESEISAPKLTLTPATNTGPAWSINIWQQ